MNYRKIAKILIYALILTHLSACGNSLNNKKIIDKNEPYYAITITSYENLRNEYIDLNVKIPKIIYKSSQSNAFIESVNDKIGNDIKQVVENVKTNAENDYLKSLEEGTQNSFNNEIISSNSNSSATSDKMRFKDKNSANFRASDSNMKSKMPPRNKAYNDGENRQEDKPVFGFTHSNDLIIPGLHNKNIIIVEPTTKETSSDNIEKNENNKKIIPNKTKNYNRYNNQNEAPNNIQTSRNKDFYITLTCDYTITCLDNEYISLNTTINTYGTNTDVKNFFYNIDLKNKKILSLKDLLDDKSQNKTTSSSFFINSNHIPVIVNGDNTLSTIN